MEDSFAPGSIIELGAENLVLALQFEPSTEVMQINVYELEHFLANPDPVNNQAQIAQYTTCPGCFTQTIADVRDMYAGWTKIDKAQTTQLIGIHNQDRNVLLIQFSLGKRYFIYERCLVPNREKVYEELFGKKHNFRLRALSREDEQYLISNLRFLPKTKKAIGFYPQKAFGVSHRKRHLSLPYSG